MSTERVTLMAVHAHPDDEVFSTGGVFARAAAEGKGTVLVCATNGEEGEIHDPDLDPEEARPRLAEIRREELRRACAVLGIETLRFLDYRDSGMAGTEANADPRNFHNADPEEVAARLVRLLREIRPHVVVTYDERGGYGHPDHVTAHYRTVEAVAASGDPDRFPELGAPWHVPKLYYAVFARSRWIEMVQAMRERGLSPSTEEEESDEDLERYTTDDALITATVDVSAYIAQKKAALNAHRTQIPEDSWVRTMPEDILESWFSSEDYRLAESRVPTSSPETDLFAGL